MNGHLQLKQPRPPGPWKSMTKYDHQSEGSQASAIMQLKKAERFVGAGVEGFELGRQGRTHTEYLASTFEKLLQEKREGESLEGVCCVSEGGKQEEEELIVARK